MSKQSPHTTLIVTIGYILIATLTIWGIKLIYDEIVKLSEVTAGTEEREELVVVGNTLVSLYKLEGTTNLAATLNMQKTKIEYDSLMNDIDGHIATLQNISTDSVLSQHLDSVSILLDMKKENTWKMLALMDSVEKKILKETYKTTVLSKKNIDDLTKILKNTTQSTEDTAIIKTEKKGFFQKLKDAFNSQATDSTIKISKNHIQITDSLEVPILIDTLTQFIDEIVLTSERKNAKFMNRLIMRQNSMNRTNEHLTTQINKIMRDIERREFDNSIKIVQEKEEVLRRSNEIVSKIGLLALSATLLFLILSLRSLNKNKKYRKALEASKKTTEKLLVARERLILSITHDIKAPLSSIIGYMELLVRSKFPDKEKYYLENVQNSADHVLDLVKNLLDYHVLESNNQTISPIPFSPPILLDSIYKSFIPLAQKGNLNLEYRSDVDEKENLNYISDPYRLRQIINNLLSNAIKFTPKGGDVLLKMSILENNEQEILEIAVKDNGPGISEEDKKSIYEEFKRLKTATGAEGTGLGLAITHKLVDLFKGEIELISELGKGSEFIVRIPIKKSDANSEKSHNTSQKIFTPRLNIGSGKKVLFIDDDMVQSSMLSELMKYEGTTPIICNDSLQALELLQREKFDIIFTDIQMPDMSGIELVERIRKGSSNNCKTVPIIALSGGSGMREQDYIEAGFSDFLPKPFTSEQLVSVILKFLEINDPDQPVTEHSVKPQSCELSALSDFAGDDVEAGYEIIKSFINENTQNLEALKDALSKNDWDPIKKISHKMLPLMQMIFANDIVDILSEFEKGNQDKEKCEILFELLKIQIKKAEDFLSLLNNDK
ncbi:MAG: response regulator [Dysgonamonadaceae bacterium]|jgi:signal transduction histidine kinase/FixJ family two-component response regulator|nr:response regulator [Dysgonamonadaceae bacterium]